MVLTALSRGFGDLPEHVWDDEEADVRTADVNLVKMRNAAVAGGDSDILKLDVHVVLGCEGA